MKGAQLIEKIKEEVGLLQLPIIVHTGKDLSADEETHLSSVTSAIVVKDARSPERIMESVSLFLHRPSEVLGADHRKMLEAVVQKDPTLAGKSVLVVDDDMRNIYALSSILEQNEMKVIFAQNGKKALAELASNPAIDIVLMDIMMPEMDGYQAMREIRKSGRFEALPIIALTAKAMKGDRERCIEAGASDYIPKPVDIERLLSLLRVWLYCWK
jgi:CheY-like chemotaxis protein